MKKIIACLLMLAMCISVFAGCKPEEAPKNDGLESAKTYLYNLYKDSPAVTADDFTRVGVVVIQGVGTYTITWTVDTDAVKVLPMGEDKMVTIDVPSSSTEEINYKLTATLSDAEGKTVSLTFEHKILASGGFPDGTYVITTADGLTLSSLAEDKNYGYPYANEVTVKDGKVTGHFKADVLTLTNIGEDGVTIQDAYGRYFYLKDSYNSFNVSAEAPAEGHIWKILQVEGGYQLVNTLNQKTLAYSTSYTSWGAYPELDDSYVAVLTITAATAPEKDPEVNVDLGIEPNANVTIQQAVTAAGITGNRETADKYYITGVITEIVSDVYGNFYIQDETGSIYVYGCYDADGTNRYDAMANAPKVGDTVTLYGVLMSYNGTAQMKNAWVTAHTPGEGTTDPTDPAATDPKPTEPATKPATKPETKPEPSSKGYNIFINNGTNALWFKGTVNGGRFDASTNASDAAVVYVEEVDGGVLLYMKDGSKKNYIVMNDESAGGALTTNASEASVFTWNADLSTYMVADPENGRAFGSQANSKYTNFSCYATSNGTNGYFWGQFLEAGSTPPADEPTKPTEPAPTEPDDNTGSDDSIVKDVTLTTGMKVVIYAPAHNKALSSNPSSAGSYYQMGVDVSVQGGKLTGWSETEVWTITVNSDGSFTMSQNGKNLGMQDQYSSMSLGAVNDDWTLESIGNGLYMIKNVVRGNCIEWYSEKNNWSSYTGNPANDLFQLAFYVVG